MPCYLYQALDHPRSIIRASLAIFPLLLSYKHRLLCATQQAAV